MKKICFVIAILALFALGFTSCSKDVEKCWKVDISMKMESMDMSVTNYIWATENDLEYNIDNLKKEYTEDGLHLNDRAYTLITDYLKPYVEE